MKAYMNLYSAQSDILLFNIFLEVISKSYSHEIMSKYNMDKNTQEMNFNYQIQS